MAASNYEDDISKLFNEMSLLNFDIGSVFHAMPTYLVDPHNFFIIPRSFLNYLPTVSKAGKPYQATELKEGAVVIFKSEHPDVNLFAGIETDKHIRGIILNIKDNKCEIRALDRGFKEQNVTVDRVFHPEHSGSLTMPPLIQHCELYWCEPRGDKFEEDAIKAFKYFMTKEMLSVLVGGLKDDRLCITAYNSNPDDISTMLIMTKYAYMVKTINGNLN